MFIENALVNPVNEFIWGLPLNKCSDRALEWKVKNLLANFQKLYGCAVNIAQIQDDYLNQKNNGTLDLLVFGANSIEYFFLKIDTIFDILYQIYHDLCEPSRPSSQGKHKHLEKILKKYKDETGGEVEIQWLESINLVRNRIAHGGYSIKCFFLERHFAFQAYDLNLVGQIKDDFGFFVNNRQIVYADLYTNFYTQKTHAFIQGFLAFLIHKVSPSSQEEASLGILEEQQKQSAAFLYYGGDETFRNISRQIGKRV